MLPVLGAGAALGVSPASVLRADEVERSVLLAAITEAAKWSEQRDRRLARMIVSELAEALRRGR